MKLGIVIPTFNRSQLLKKLLNQIFRFDQSNQEIYVIIVNDGSTDETSEILDLFNLKEKFFIIDGDGSWWWTKSFNEGMVFSFDKLNADYVLSLNDDVEIYADFFIDLKNTVEKLELLYNGKYLINCGCKNIITNEYYDLGMIKNYINPFRHKKNVAADFKNEDYIAVNHNHGRGLLITKVVYELTGEFDHKTFPQYFGDSDYALRALRLGTNQFFSTKPYIKCHVDLTGKTKYEQKYTFKNFYSRLVDKYSDSNLITLFKFNRKHYKGFQLYYLTFCDFTKVIGGYLKRWINTKINSNYAIRDI